MPNRILKESLCTSEDYAGLTLFERDVFIRLLVTVDDFGLMDARPQVLRGRMYPLEERLDAHVIEKAVDRLAARGMLRRYAVDGRPYLMLTAFLRHQRKRAMHSKWPLPEDFWDLLDDDIRGRFPQAAGNRGQPAAPADIRGQLTADDGNRGQPPASADICGQLTADDGKCGQVRAPADICGHPRTSAPEKRETRTRETRNENREIEKHKLHTPVRRRALPGGVDERFDAFWDAYPRKVAKQAARDAWLRLAPDAQLCQTMLEAIARQKAWKLWNEEAYRYVPHPATWLNGSRWEDEAFTAEAEEAGTTGTPGTPGSNPKEEDDTY